MKIEEIIIERDYHRHHHHLAAAAAAASATTIQTPGVTTPTTTLKRSSSLVINAPSSKNHKNETTCTKMSDENNSISATAIAIKKCLNGATINTSSSSSSSLTSSSSPLSTSSLSSAAAVASSSTTSGTATVAAVTDSRIHVSRANPIHSSSNHHHHSTSNNNGTTSTTATTTLSNRHTSGNIRIKTEPIENSGSIRIKTEPIENNGGGADFSTCKSLVVGPAGNEVVGRIPTSSSSAAAAGAVSGGDSGRSMQGVGGRLQFFKDGKFILELARAKEGEKSGWVSVPRKQFRSPSATSSTVTPTYPKNESSTSLSFSDDNSSIQSSPWQRDHCWKQSTPRRGISKEMCFHFMRTKHILVSPNGIKSARIKRRRPLDNSVCQTPFTLQKNGCSLAAEIKIKSEENLSSDEGSTSRMDEGKNSSDDSSTEKEDSVRESSKTPTPESPSDTVDAPVKVEITKINQITRKTNTATTRSMNGEKRLKSRAKLPTIIKKLIDRFPTGLLHLSKTQIIGGATQQHTHSHSHHQTHLAHNIPSTSSRLSSELHYHQQHVSPRKRILREFEKVSLEDSPTVNSKRSRAKGNSPAAAVGTLPLAPIPTSRGVVVPSSSSNYVTNGSRMEAVTSNSSNVTTPNSTPTRVYSSYSIHSLLGGNSGSSSNSNSANNSRIKVEHSVNQSGGSGGYNDPSYLRAMLASPKSPEGCSNSKSSPYSAPASGSAKKRSPPYSPLSEIHHQLHSRNRSPNVDATYGNMRSPPEAHSNRSYANNGAGSSGSISRLTPPQGYLSSPKNSSNSSSADGYKLKSENLTNSSPNHHFYSPYMVSPKYVPPPSSISPNNLHTSDNYHPKLKGARSPSQQNLRAGVFRTQSPHATTNPRESSPIALQSSPSSGGGQGGGGMTTSSSTPRTVPKKTVSIRRQFASPSSSSPSPGLSEHMKNAGNNSISKGEERTAMSPDSRRTPTQDSAVSAAVAAAAASKYHQHANAAAAAAAAMMQRSSPLGGGASSLYYMYPPPNGSPSPHHSSSSPSPSPSSSYIPQMNPYYPYLPIALRNPLWMHHYPGAAAAAAAAAGAAAAMLPSSATAPVPQQAVPFFPYNGVSATTPSHLHHSSFAPMHLASAGQLGLQPPPPPASLNRSPPTTDDTISPSSIKEEHSSDVPLNLSKH